jgi:hypothetical protein
VITGGGANSQQHKQETRDYKIFVPKKRRSLQLIINDFLKHKYFLQLTAWRQTVALFITQGVTLYGRTARDTANTGAAERLILPPAAVSNTAKQTAHLQLQ